MVYSLITVLMVALTFSLLLIFKNKISKKYIDLGLKVAAVAFFTLGVFRSFLNDDFVWMINGGTYGDTYYKHTDIIQSLLRWGHYLSYVVFPCACFFNKRIFKNVSIYFCFFVVVIELFFFEKTMVYFLTDSGRGIYLPPITRYVEYIAELFLALLIPLVLRFIVGHKFDVKNKAEWSYFVGILPLMLITVMPVYLLQSLFGFTNRKMKPLSIENIAWIIVNFVMMAILYIKLKNKDRETKYSTLIFLALLLFIHYNSIYLMDLVAARLPFQLCNLGAYIILIAFLLRKQSVFNFVFLANVPGAIIALVAVDASSKLLSFWSIHFYIEHTWVFILPILAVLLGIFERPKISSFKHFFIGFTTYFVICATVGIILNCFCYEPYHHFFNKVNYFYIFDTTVISFLPFLSFTRKLEILINGTPIYPVYMLLIYILFTVFCFIFYYVYNVLCDIANDHRNLSKIKKQMRIDSGYYEKRKKPIPHDHE